jgi:anti-sigma regulatory factor (Ser/Thr protein kinase)
VTNDATEDDRPAAAVPALPLLRGANAAVRVSRGHRTGRGADWYDVVALEDGHVALVVGHVPGGDAHVPAAVLAERLRGATTSVLALGRGASDALASIRTYASYQPELEGATLCLVVLDPSTGRLECATAGHPGPLLLGADGALGQLVGARGGPLLETGPVDAASRDDAAIRMGPGEVVLLYSAEAVRRRATRSTGGTERFAELVAQHATTDPDRLCSALVKELPDEADSTGDALLLALTPGEFPDGSFQVEIPADPGCLSVLRHDFGDWLDGLALDEDDAYGLLLAVNEAVSNAVEHAYGPRGDPAGTVRLTAGLGRDGTVRVVVADRGRWRTPPAALTSRGRGLLLMRESVDQVLVDRAESGTTVVLCLAPKRVAGPRGSRNGAEPAGPRGHEVAVQENSGSVGVVVRGEVPAHAATALRRTLLTAARGGSVPIVVDLTGAGPEVGGVVSALLAVAEAAVAAGNRVVVRAATGSPARDALAAAGLHRAADVREV